MANEIVILISVIIAIITGLGEAVKIAGLPIKLIPLFSILIGIPAGMFVVFPENLTYGIVSGVAMGLSAVGLFSSAKNVGELLKNKK